MWYKLMPDSNCTYYPHFEKLPEFSTKLKHFKLYKLSWMDLDPYYLIDPASIRIARLLINNEKINNEKINNDRCILDMCSAPGGKSLIILDSMLNNNNNNNNNDCKLISNDMGFKRKSNLQQVINSFIPSDIQKKHLILTNVDGKLLGLAQPNKYDGVLLDAPCSSDRHSLQFGNNKNNGLSKWSLKSCKNLAKTQYGLLRSALDTVKIGGYVVYATCTMNQVENDQIIHQILKKRQGKVELISDIALNIGERTEFGWQILPDISPFYEGPLFVSILRRIN